MLSAETGPGDRRLRAVAARRRATATLALLALAAVLIALVVALVRDPIAGVVALAGLLVAAQLGWQGALRTGGPRALCFVAAAVAIAWVLAVLAARHHAAYLVLCLAGAAVATFSVRAAFGPRGSAGGRWQPVAATQRPVVLINPRSGDGRAERVGLAGAARARGIETVILEPGGDLPALAREAVAGGADVLGMAGGDGSMAIVATIAAEHGIPFVCIPAGTRNHFAVDLGVRRDDVVGALDAFVDGVESTVDVGVVNDRPFVNNVSLGVYAQAVHDPAYRGAKLRTLRRAAKDLLGPSGAVPRMSVVDDLGREHASAALILVSNNPYALRRALGQTTRPALDEGRLGVILLTGHGGDRAWEPPTLTVTAPGPAASAIDGEAVTLDPPLSFALRAGWLRVRISARHPGVSPSGLLPPSLASAVPRLVRIAAGR